MSVHFLSTFIWDILGTAGFHLLGKKILKICRIFCKIRRYYFFDWLYSKKRSTVQYWQGQIETTEEQWLVLARPVPLLHILYTWHIHFLFLSISVTRQAVGWVSVNLVIGVFHFNRFIVIFQTVLKSRHWWILGFWKFWISLHSVCI